MVLNFSAENAVLDRICPLDELSVCSELFSLNEIHLTDLISTRFCPKPWMHTAHRTNQISHGGPS